MYIPPAKGRGAAERFGPLVQIRRVAGKRDLKAFVKLPFALYRACPLWVPPLMADEMATLDPARNPMFESSEARLFLAYKDGRAVGRIAGILSRTANRKNGARNLRFGWFDTVEDLEVARALLGAVEQWAGELGMETITGPQGFGDFDRQGMLIEGFDKPPTIAVHYNFPYYPVFMEHCGFAKDVDYVEYQLYARDHEVLPEKLSRMAEIVRKRNGVSLLEGFPKRYILDHSRDILSILNESYSDLYGTVPFTQEQFDYYLKKYLPLIDTRLLRILVDGREEPVGFVLAIPSLSRAFQKAKGKILPLGWFHVMSQLKRADVVDIYLVALMSKYHGSGAPFLMISDLFQYILENFAIAETNPILESNRLMRSVVEVGNAKLHKRRRVYVKHITESH